MENPTIKQEPDEPEAALEDNLLLKPRSRSRRRTGWVAWILSIGARLAIWSCVFIIAFRCPSSVSDITETSPRICRPYLEARTRVTPFVQPYYDAYAAHYVNLARPYFEKFHTDVYTPAVAYGKNSYDQYAAPRVSEVQKAAQKEWEKSLRPRLDEVRSKARGQYDRSVAPVIYQAFEFSEPFIENAKKTVLHQYHSNAIPAYEKSLPYVQQAYQRGRYLTIDIALPYARYGTDVTLRFLTRNIWPRIRILYGENVEPQLVKIRERLANYRDAKSIEAVVEDFDKHHPTSSTELPSSTSFEEPPTQIIGTVSDYSHLDSDVETSKTMTDFAHPTKEPQRQISEDLKVWQEKFAKAADKGADDLQERVSKITAQQIESQGHGVGEALVVQLEESVHKAVEGVKKAIVKVINELPEEPNDDDNDTAVGSVLIAVRTAGKLVKAKAQEVRSWKVKYDQDTTAHIRSAQESTLDVIDNIRDLGLQEIGMRWASMDGVTYKDWSEYHTLKKTFDEWRITVENVAINHEGAAKARQVGEDVESRAMSIAEDAAKELARLKDVAAWKVHAKDRSDDFSTKTLPAKAIKAGQKILDNISSAGAAILGSDSSQDPIESVLSLASAGVTGVVVSVASIAADVVSGVNSGSSLVSSMASSGAEALSITASSAAVEASSGADDISSSLSTIAESIIPDTSFILEPTTTSNVLSTLSKISEKVLGSSEDVFESLTAKAKDSSSTVISQVSEQTASFTSESAFDIPVIHDPTSSTASDVKASTPVESDNAQQSVSSAIKEKVESLTEAVKGSPAPPSSATDSVSSIESQAGKDADTSSGSGAATESDDAKLAWSRSIMSMVSSKNALSEASGTIAPQSATFAQPEDVSSEYPKMSYSQNLQEAIKQAGARAAEITSSLAAARDSDAPAETTIPDWTIHL